MKNDAITLLRADLRVQITSLKRIIRRLLKKERGSEGKRGTNPDVYVSVHTWVYVYIYKRMRVLIYACSYIFKWKTARRRDRRLFGLSTCTQAGWGKRLNLKQRQPNERRKRRKSLQGKVIWIQSLYFPRANWLSYPGLIHFSRCPSPSHPGGIHPYFAFSFPAASPSAPRPGGRLPGPWRARGPLRARGRDGGEGGPPPWAAGWPRVPCWAFGFPPLCRVPPTPPHAPPSRPSS